MERRSPAPTGTDTSVQVSYVGNKGTHVFAGNGPSYNVNQPSIVGFASGVPQNQRRPFHNKFIYSNFLVTDPANPTGPKIPLTCCDSDLGNYLGNDASTNYNALQVLIEKRFSHGLQFLTHYTWAHSNNYDGNYYVDDPRVAYGPMDDVRRHVWVANVVYELPFGRGKMFASGASRAVDYVVGGWQITNTSNWSTGLPFTPSTAECGPQQDVGVCRPNKGSGSFNVGAGSFDPINHQVTYFTPLTSLTGPYTDPGRVIWAT